MQGSYESYDNPPRLVDPFRNYWTKAFRMEWWRQQLAFLRDSSHELAVDAAYMWPAGSWDVAAIYHASSKGACHVLRSTLVAAYSHCSLAASTHHASSKGAVAAATRAGACSCVQSIIPSCNKYRSQIKLCGRFAAVYHASSKVRGEQRPALALVAAYCHLVLSCQHGQEQQHVLTNAVNHMYFSLLREPAALDSTKCCTSLGACHTTVGAATLFTIDIHAVLPVALTPVVSLHAMLSSLLPLRPEPRPVRL
jgi:hypothetical protein